jgi:hypothetical protein
MVTCHIVSFSLHCCCIVKCFNKMFVLFDENYFKDTVSLERSLHEADLRQARRFRVIYKLNLH